MRKGLLGAAAFILITVSAAGQSVGLIKFVDSLSNRDWNIKAPIHSIPANGMDKVSGIWSVTIECKNPVQGKKDYYARFRIDEIHFDLKEAIPAGNKQSWQIYQDENFPAKRYALDSRGMNFTNVQWEYDYVIHRAFRKGNKVYVIYTDAAVFLDPLDEFTSGMINYFNP